MRGFTVLAYYGIEGTGFGPHKNIYQTLNTQTVNAIRNLMSVIAVHTTY